MLTTLDQWEVLRAVVHSGGFGAAAKQLNRSQSTMSYAIARLEDQLGIKLFEMQGRRTHLTETGRLLLAEVEPHLAGFQNVEERAFALASGGATEIRLSVDSIFPSQRLFTALAEFTRQFPSVQPRLRQETFLSADAEFSLHNAQVCITGLFTRELLAKPILGIRMLAVARHDHPLNGLRRRFSRADLLQHTLVSIEGAASGTLKHQPRSPAQRVLQVSSIEAALDAVRSGFCFGWLPAYRIEAELGARSLLPLQLTSGGTRHFQLSLVCQDHSNLQGEVNALAGLLGLGREPEQV